MFTGIALPLLVASGVLYAMGGSLRFRITRADLAEALDRTLKTEHFVLHYARGGKSPADVALTGEDLEFRYQQLQDTLRRHPGGADVSRPQRWGGFRVLPTRVEFWQESPDGLHDRIRYRREGGGWMTERLSP